MTAVEGETRSEAARGARLDLEDVAPVKLKEGLWSRLKGAFGA